MRGMVAWAATLGLLWVIWSVQVRNSLLIALVFVPHLVLSLPLSLSALPSHSLPRRLISRKRSDRVRTRERRARALDAARSGAFTLEPGKCQAQQDATAIDVVYCRKLCFFPSARNYAPVAPVISATVPWRLSNVPINDCGVCRVRIAPDRSRNRCAPLPRKRLFFLFSPCGRVSRNCERARVTLGDATRHRVSCITVPFAPLCRIRAFHFRSKSYFVVAPRAVYIRECV